MKPIAEYHYVEEQYNKEEAVILLKDALNENKSIICKVIEYDKNNGELNLTFYGYKGIIERGHISKFVKTDVTYFRNRALRVYVKKFDEDNDIFYASRLEIEEEAESYFSQIQKGDEVEGIVTKILKDKECAFIDLCEGICAYIDLRHVTCLPNTCCSIDEFLEEGQKIRAKVDGIPYDSYYGSKNGSYYGGKSGIILSLLQSEKSFEEMCTDYKLGDIYEGIIKEDNMYSHLFYILTEKPQIYIKFKSLKQLKEGDTCRVILKRYNYEEKCLEATLENEILSVSKPNVETQIEYGSMFQKEVKAVRSPFAIRMNESKRFETDRVTSIPINTILDRYKKWLY